MAIRRTAFRAVCVFLIAVASAFTIALIPVETERSGAAAWAASLTENERVSLATSSNLAQLPVDYRRGLLQTLDLPAQKAAYWQTVFRNYRYANRLTTAQDRSLREAEQLLTPEFFSRRTSVSRAEQVRHVKQRIVEQLGSAAGEELFRAAGPEVRSTAHLPTPERLRAFWRANRPVGIVRVASYVAPALLASHCNCLDQGDCSYETVCGNPSGTTCDVQSWGCGDWNLSGCGSICYYPSPQG